MSSSAKFLNIQIRQQTLALLIASRHVTAEELRGLTPFARQQLRQIILDCLRERGPEVSPPH